MFGFSESQDAYDKVEAGHHASLSHEAIAAAASFEVSPQTNSICSEIDVCKLGYEGIREPPTSWRADCLTRNC